MFCEMSCSSVILKVSLYRFLLWIFFFQNLNDICWLVFYRQICRTCVVSIEHHDVCLIKSHAICGYPVKDSSDGSLICSFCHLKCDSEILDSFQLKVTLSDETGQLFAWCTCQTATELLQITPDEYIQLPVV